MIEEIRVRGMGGIRAATLSFCGKFIVITGESGSGKSSLVRAFEFVSGKRSQAAAIHADCDEAVVEALWDEESARLAGIDDDALLTKRSLLRNGKSRSYIGGELSTAGALAALSSSLIEIQSQFAQLSLLDPARQLEIVDSCGTEELRETKDALASLFPRMIELEKEIISLRKRATKLATELEGSDRRIRLIRALAPSAGCERLWTEELAQLEKQEEETARGEQFLARLEGGDGEATVLDQLTQLLRELYALAPENLQDEWSRLGENALIDLQRLFDSARSNIAAYSHEDLEKRREAAERRLGALRKLMRETGVAAEEDLISYADEAEEEARWLAASGSLIEIKTEEAHSMKGEVGALARTLRACRIATARVFEERVRSHLADLAMETALFSAAIQKQDKVRSMGAESVSFTLSIGETAPNPVAKVASGGELSRILIAIEASLDASRLPGVLVFDEVEAGLGGRTALLAGRKLKSLSDSCQTILITHEATIAAMADQHFVVVRNGDETEVREISGEEREVEIARMLAGSASQEALAHARSLLSGHTDGD